MSLRYCAVKVQSRSVRPDLTRSRSNSCIFLLKVGRVTPRISHAFPRCQPEASRTRAMRCFSRSIRARQLAPSRASEPIRADFPIVLPLAHDQGSCKDILEFSNIPGPVVSRQHIKSAFTNIGNPVAEPSGHSSNQPTGKNRYVTQPVAQRRQPDRHLGQPIKQVGTERLILNGNLKVLVCCGNHANIRADWAPPPHTVEFPAVENPQQLCLE